MNSLNTEMIFKDTDLIGCINNREADEAYLFDVLVITNECGLYLGMADYEKVSSCENSSALIKDFISRDYISVFKSSEPNFDNSSDFISLDTDQIYIPVLNDDNSIDSIKVNSKVKKISVLEPVINEGKELDNIVKAVKSGWISSKGEFVTQFESLFNEYIGSEYSITSSNGTTALHLALEALGIGAGDEVIVPNLTFGASVSSILHAGATPVLADVDFETWNITAENIETLITDKTKAVMIVHLYGKPCDMDPIMKLVKDSSLLLIEDCAEALGSKYKGQFVGTFGDAAAFSFFGNKVITTGEGGMLCCKNEEVYQRASVLRDHGMSPQKRYWHEVVGYNYRMTNLQAAIGVAQMEQVEKFIFERNRIFECYNKLFENYSFLLTPVMEKGDSRHNCWLYTLVLKPSLGIDRDTLIEKLLDRGVDTRPVFYPMADMPAFSDFGNQSKLANSTLISYQGISLPSSCFLSNSQVKYISKNVIEVIQSLQTEEVD